ncbi:peptidoglycan D,D-transpeptidase FtsI family protein [Actinomyces mediterranea]|uniref:peptidoglycan D,D-transpeptidase FtsI family protein n=1 Tax=Actinomyces mediterranea TaxID=1871028 RepID=UPI0009711A7A|nr:penicillin-binding protein 2 [Actinomyces mediterranea]
MTSVRRSRVILGIIVVVLSLCAARLVDLQIIQGPSLAAEGEEVRTSTTAITAKRGTITDATGVVLADSILTYDIAVNQVNIRSYVHYEEETVGGVTRKVEVGRGPAEAARQLADPLGIDAAELGGLFVGDSTYAYVKRNVDAMTYRAIRALNIYGIEWEAVYERTYPNGNVAAPVVGTVNAEGVGSSGLEAQFDELLQGVPGTEAFEIAPNGAILPGGKKTTKEPADGGSLTVTIRADLQHIVQKLLDARVAQHEAEWGAVVIEDVSTGQVLVLADSNSTEPDNAKPQPVSAVQYAVEPGSVGKVVTFATALDAGAITPTTQFTVPYSLDMPDAGGSINDFHYHDVEALTATGILAESSNTGTVLVGQTVSDEQRYEMMQRIGFGSLTGIELAGETAGIVRPASEWAGRDRYVSMFGQSYSISVLQEASLMATIANGGVRIAPRLVKSWTNADGTVETPEQPEPTQVMSADTAQQLMLMMESVVSDQLGTAGAAKVDGYRLAVKTGTADIIVDGQQGIVSTTAGLLPVDAPRLAISVVLYNPKVGYISSDSSAPLFGDIAREAVRNLGIPASSQAPQLYPTTPQQ